MPIYQFDDGTRLRIEGDPTPDEIDEAYQLAIAPTPQPSEGDQLEGQLQQQQQQEAQQQQQIMQTLGAAVQEATDPRNLPTKDLKTFLQESPPQDVGQYQELARTLRDKEEQDRLREKGPIAVRATASGKALVKGAAAATLSLPSSIANLTKEFGEKIEESPDYWQQVIAPETFTEGSLTERAAAGARAARPFDPLGMQGLGAMKLLIKNTTGIDVGQEIIEASDRVREANQQFLARPEFQPAEGSVNRFMFDLGAGGASLAQSIGLFAITKSPLASGVAFGALEKSNLYQDARRRGVSPEVAGELSTVGGVINGAIEMVGLKFFMRNFGSIWRGIAARAAEEGLQEGAQEFSGNVIAANWRDYDSYWDLIDNVGRSALIGGLLGGGSTMVLHAMLGSDAEQKIEDLGMEKKDAEKVVKQVVEAQAEQLGPFIEEATNVMLDPARAERLVEAPPVQSAEDLQAAAEPAAEGDAETSTEGVAETEEAAAELPKRPTRKAALNAATRKALEIPEIRQITIREDVALRQQIRRESMAARRGFTEGQQQTRQRLIAEFRQAKQDVAQTKQQVVDYVNQNLPVAQRGAFLAAVKNTSTQNQLFKVFDRVDATVARLASREAINELRQELRDIDMTRLRPEYVEQLAPIAEALDPSKPTPNTLSRLKRMADFVAEHPENQIPESQLRTLDRLERVPMAELTTEDVESITDTVRHLVRLNDLKNKILLRRQIREYQEVKEDVEFRLANRSEQLNGSITGLDSFQQEQEAGKIERIFGADSFNAELKTEILDGADDGPMKDILFAAIDAGVNTQLAHEHAAQDFFREALGDIDISKWSKQFQLKEKNVEKVSVDISGGRKLVMSKGERVAFYLHSLNWNNTQHLVNGGFSFADSPSQIQRLTDADVETVVASITPEELVAANAISTWFNQQQKQAINEVSVRLNGHEIAREPNYFPIRTNFLDRFRQDLVKAGTYSQKTLEGLGIFKKRQGSENALIVEDAFLATYKSVHAVSAYVGLAEPLRHAKQLINDNDINIAARQAGVNHYISSLKRYVRQIEDNSHDTTNADRLTQEWINKLDVSILGLNPFVMMKQPISFMGASTEIDWQYLLPVMASPVTTQVQKRMRETHPQLRDRLEGNVSREVGEVGQVGRPRKFWTGGEGISQKFMAGIKNFDTKAVGRIYMAAEAEIADLQPELEPGTPEFQRAVGERAWEVIRLTQPTFHVKDRSTVGADRSTFIRLMTKYSSQRNKNYMMLRRAMERYNRSDKTKTDHMRVMNALTTVGLMSPMLLIAVDESRDKLYGFPEKQNFFLRALNIVMLNFGNVYFLGPIASSAASKIERGIFQGYEVDDVVTDTMEEGAVVIASLVRAAQFAAADERYTSGPQEFQKKWPKELKRAFLEGLDITGRIRGIPIHTMRRWLEVGQRALE